MLPATQQFLNRLPRRVISDGNGGTHECLCFDNETFLEFAESEAATPPPATVNQLRLLGQKLAAETDGKRAIALAQQIAKLVSAATPSGRKPSETKIVLPEHRLEQPSLAASFEQGAPSDSFMRYCEETAAGL